MKKIFLTLLAWSFLNACARASYVELDATPGVITSAKVSGGREVFTGYNLDWLGRHGVFYRIAIHAPDLPFEGEEIKSWLGGQYTPGDTGFVSSSALDNTLDFFVSICSSDTTYYSKSTCTNAVPAN